MSYHYFETEPILERVELEDSFLILVNPAPKKLNAKSKEDKEHNARVQTQTDGLHKSLAIIATGHVDLNNRPIEFDNIFQTFDWWENFDNLHIYYCKPTSAKKPWSRYSSYDEKMSIYEFDVVRKFASRDELATFLVEKYRYAELITKIIELYSDNNEESSAKLKQYVEYVANLVPDALSKNVRWNDDLYWVAKKINNRGGKTDSNILWAIQNGYVTVDASYTSDETIMNLCSKRFYMSLLEYVKRLNPANKEKIGYSTKKELTSHSDIPEVAEVLDLLGLSTPMIELVVVKSGHYCSDTELERVEFKTMNEVKTYIIKHYDMGFSSLLGNSNGSIPDIRLNDETWIEFRTTVKGQ